MNLRPYEERDLKWVEILARKYNEWTLVSQLLEHPLENKVFGMWVVEPLCLIGVREDDCGWVAEGLCAEDGVKALWRLTKEYTKHCNDKGLPLHTHVEKGSWQYEFFKRLGYVKGDIGTLSSGGSHV